MVFFFRALSKHVGKNGVFFLKKKTGRTLDGKVVSGCIRKFAI